MNHPNITKARFSLMNAEQIEAAARKALPWLGGAGMALGHAAVSSNCTIPQQGQCSSCGSCVVVVGSLVVWALAKKRGEADGDSPFTPS